MQIKELFTRKRHNEGVKLDVKDESGAVVGWIRVRGLDSDAYRSAHDSASQAMVRLAGVVRAGGAGAALLPATQAEKDEAQLAERVALVAEWSFDDACTVANVTDLFREAPYLSDQVYYVACDRDRFLGINSPASTDGQNINSDSANPPQQDQITASPLP
jgi:hypothetical protein